MALQNEQDRLVADTLAVVQRLAEAPSTRVAPPPLLAIRPAAHPRYVAETDLRKEMHARLEAFRNRQRFLEIEREAYYQQAMQRIRAMTEQNTEH